MIKSTAVHRLRELLRQKESKMQDNMVYGAVRKEAALDASALRFAIAELTGETEVSS